MGGVRGDLYNIWCKQALYESWKQMHTNLMPTNPPPPLPSLPLALLLALPLLRRNRPTRLQMVMRNGGGRVSCAWERGGRVGERRAHAVCYRIRRRGKIGGTFFFVF